MRRKALLDKLVQSRFRQKNDIRKLLDDGAAARRRRGRRLVGRKESSSSSGSYYDVRGVHRGNFFRIRVAPKKEKFLPNIPKLLAPQSQVLQAHDPKNPGGASVTQLPPLAAVSSSSSSSLSSSSASSNAGRGSSSRQQKAWREWWSKNWPVLVLNFGSICALTGFTRSDILELRSFSVAGSLGSMIYSAAQKPIMWAPMAWSSCFVSVNSWKIWKILEERKAEVHFTEEQEYIYHKFFLPHGVTPKQFEIIDDKAETLHLKRGHVIMRRGDKIESVFLIVSGSTRANILGRHLTAISMKPVAAAPENRNGQGQHHGGSGGAWIGEMRFLEAFWNKEQLVLQKSLSKPTAKPFAESSLRKISGTRVATTGQEATTVLTLTTDDTEKPSMKPEKDGSVKKDLDASAEPTSNSIVRSASQPQPKSFPADAMYTIVCDEDCTVMRWSVENMEQLMHQSTDLRAALTRAMLSAIVAKVIDFTISKSKTRPNWSSWVDWKYDTTGVRIPFSLTQSRQGEEQDKVPKDEEGKDSIVLPSNLPNQPIDDLLEK